MPREAKATCSINKINFLFNYTKIYNKREEKCFKSDHKTDKINLMLRHQTAFGKRMCNENVLIHRKNYQLIKKIIEFIRKTEKRKNK